MGIRDDLYGLDHAILHISVPPENMWMNMGYWRDTTSFPVACQALLDEVLNAAGLLDKSNNISNVTSNHSPEQAKGKTEHCGQPTTMRLIDVGFGCGDQSLYLTRKLHRRDQSHFQALPTSAGSGSDPVTQSNQQLPPLFDSYIGMNITPSQVDIASKRLSEPSGNEFAPSSRSTPKVELFVADAGNPASWDSKIKKAIYCEPAHNTEQDTIQPTGEIRTWLLALDTLYHFKPSRLPLFTCAYKDMQASIMAFDLLISDSASFWDLTRLRLMCLVTGIPYSNFKTMEEYKAMLGLAGYDQALVEMRDISEHVFAGLAHYIRAKEAELNVYGMTVGKFKSPAKVFDWWATSGVVRGYVIVAHRT